MNEILNVFLLQTPAGGEEGQGGSPYTMLIMFGLIFVVFYFFMIRPQVRKQKEMKNFRESLQKGDKIVTTGGIYGKIADIKDTHILVEVDSNMRLKVDKNAILRDPADLPQQK